MNYFSISLSWNHDLNDLLYNQLPWSTPTLFGLRPEWCWKKCWKSFENWSCPARYDRYISNVLLLWIFLIVFIMVFYVNGMKALYVNTGCLGCISDMTLSLANNYCIHLLYSKNKTSLNNGVLNLNWLTNLLASLSLINLDLLLFHTAYFNKSVSFALLVFETLPF